MTEETVGRARTARPHGCSAGPPCSSAGKTSADAMLERSDRLRRPRHLTRAVAVRRLAEVRRVPYRPTTSPSSRTIPTPGRSTSARRLKDVPLPDGPVPDPLDPHIVHTFTRKANDRIDMETRDEKGRVARAVVAYALGSGEHGVTMVTRDEPAGTHRQLADLLLHGRAGLARDERGQHAARTTPPISSGWSSRRSRCASACNATRRGSAPRCRSRRSPAAPSRPTAGSAASGATGPGSTT